MNNQTLADKIIAYRLGKLSMNEITELFQVLFEKDQQRILNKCK